MDNLTYGAYLAHHGIKGQKWGIRRYQNSSGSLTPAGKKRYSSTSLKAKIAKRSNDKIDNSFKKWDENNKKKNNAIDLGKKMNADKMAYEQDHSNKEAKKQYKNSKKQYKKALSENTTYRKGSVRKEVGQDISRKYLSEAKKVKKQLDSDPGNKQLQKKYNDLMSKHDVERAKARKAQSVATKRMNKERSIKSTMTKTVKAAVATAAVSAGLAAVNKYIVKDKFNMNINSEQILDFVKKGKRMMGYIY